MSAKVSPNTKLSRGKTISPAANKTRRKLDASSGGNAKTAARIASEITTYITDNDLSEGAKLPSEREMVTLFGAGRWTIREALRLLELVGVIRIRMGRNGGPTVHEPMGNDLSQPLQLVLQFQNATIHDVLDARIVLLPQMTRLASETIQAADIKVLRRCVAEMDKATDELQFLEINAVFERTIAVVSQNVVLQIMSHIIDAIGYGAVKAANIKYSIAMRHRQIMLRHDVINSLEARDGAAAEAQMREVLETSKQIWMRDEPELFNRRVCWIPTF